ncbi:uncharacterized protein LOC143917362 [Arctopsyche grandis]|uniref:uncharacterized protein LOC143917362 n=1 Tax=Arctopsyche grandis TaxID=121162 RepID=UPI00406D9B94
MSLALNISVLILFIHNALVIGDFLGPADVNLKRMEKCGDDVNDFVFEMTMNKLNRSHMGINGRINLPFALDENVSVNFTCSKWGDGGWKPNYLDAFEKDVCSSIMTYSDNNFKTFLQIIGQPPKCPLAPGKYVVKDYVFDGQVKVPLMYGDFKIEIMFVKDSVQLTCFRVFAEAVTMILGGYYLIFCAFLLIFNTSAAANVFSDSESPLSLQATNPLNTQNQNLLMTAPKTRNTLEFAPDWKSKLEKLVDVIKNNPEANIEINREELTPLAKFYLEAEEALIAEQKALKKEEEGSEEES